MATVCLSAGRKALGPCPGRVTDSSQAPHPVQSSSLSAAPTLWGGGTVIYTRVRKRDWKKWVRINPGQYCQALPLLHLLVMGGAHVSHFSSQALVLPFACCLE